MSEYVIRMADERGQVLEQIENAYSADALRDHFAQQGYLVYSVKPRGLLAGGEVHLPRRRRVKLEEFIIFNQQFVTLIRAGLPILMGLELLSKRQRNAYFRSLLEDVRNRVKSGELLSEAFQAQGVFPKIYTTTLLAGEKSGNLEEVLSRYIGFQRVAISFRKKLSASLIYPALLIVLVVIMLTFLMTYVVPQFAGLYNQLDAQLPPLTTFMLSVGLAIRHYFLAIVAGIVIVLLAAWKWKKSASGAARIDTIRLKVPVLGAIWLKYQVSLFARMLSTLLTGGLPLVPALETAASSMQSAIMSRGIQAASRKVRQGGPLARSLEESKAFPALAVEMVEVGESTGALPAMLNSVADFYEEDVQTALAAAMSLIEPVILVCMGVIVAFVLLSLYLPIFSLGAQGIH